ncbi:ABC transporter substrate-binding protein [Allofournierella sp.]|uniref:ABC transporter substrate-binding protein n=1 Tax=Allofournierella sp. TaxID=1940256 RepID=UPI003AB8A9CE
MRWAQVRKTFGALAGCLFFTLFLTGCGSQINFTWTVDRVPQNLDPQLAAESPELIAVANLYSGLTRLDEAGQPQLDCASAYTVSPDGLTYTFTLKEGLGYARSGGQDGGYALTAHDFVFAFRRIFRAETASPYTSTFALLQNSQAVLAGEAPESALGVSAPSDTTFVLQLSTPDPELLQKLALPGAMPCNEAFFDSTQGAYGLNRSATLTNGPFYLYNWNTNGLFLRRAAQGDRVTSLRLVLNSTAAATSSPGSGSGSGAVSQPLTGAELVLAGKATAALSDSTEAGSLASLPYTATTWALAFNCENELLAQPQLRAALAASARAAAPDLPAEFAVADGLVPPAVTAQGEPYRQAAGSALPAYGDPAALCREGLAAAGANRFSGITVLLPQGQPYRSLAGALNQQWQKQLGAWSAYFSLEELPPDQLAARVAAGDYQIALLPFSPSSDSALEVLEQVGLSHWNSPDFEAALAALRAGGGNSPALLAQAERLALGEAAVVPLWYHSQALLVQPGVRGLVFRPFGPVLDLTWATLKE